ncbi:MAG: ribonuclease D [Gammaproteobacteria bacterium]|nr:ribonuclease D [Gammaproteobacteria bacterium]
MNYSYIETNDQLVEACQQLSNSDFICVDTEFHREKTYYPELALIQISNEGLAFCIDPLSITDLQPILDLFNDTSCTKVFHAAQQDIEIFHHHFNTIPQPVFDTQIASTLLGYGEQIGYAALIKEILDIDVDKTQTRTDWMQRPLNNKQLDYAASDVIHLAQAYPLILEQLNKRNRLDWLSDDFNRIAQQDQYQVNTSEIWKKVKGHQRLHGQQLAILQSLASWRELTAQEKDRPRRKIVSDDALIDIARQKLNSASNILALRSISQSRISQTDANSLALKADEGLKLDKTSWPALPKKQKLSFNDEAVVDGLTAILKILAHEYKISHNIIAPRKQLEALVRGEKELPLLTGWRKQHGGQTLVDFLDGKLSIHIVSGKFSIQNAL